MEQTSLDTKALFAPKKGKQATKGQKQTYEENMATIKYYSIMAISCLSIRCVLMWALAHPFFVRSELMTIFAIMNQVGAIGVMYYMAKPVLSGQTVVDGGIDLNLPGGFAGYLTDLIITASFLTALTSVVSSWFWILWLWWPIYIIVKIWNGIVAPWIFQPAPEEPEVTEKKRKKIERKMGRGFR